MSESNFHLNSVLPFLFQIVSRDRIINIFCASNSLLPFHININSCFSLLFRNGLGRFLQNVNLLLRSHDFRQTRTLIIIHLLLGEMQVSAFILPEKQTFRAEPTNFLTFTLLSPQRIVFCSSFQVLAHGRSGSIISSDFTKFKL